MSAESWIAEFYPKPANKTAEGEAVQHSLQKWVGLRTESLYKHGLKEPPIFIDGSSCALCHHYLDDDADFSDESNSRIKPTCQTCPLAQSMGRACDQEVEEASASPWSKWIDDINPEPMIKALEAVK